MRCGTHFTPKIGPLVFDSFSLPLASFLLLSVDGTSIPCLSFPLVELNTSLIARFYKINFDSEIRNIHLLMGNPKEYLLSNGLMLVDCPRAEMTYVFDDDLQV